MTRSYSRIGYYDSVKDRPNLEILTGWRVNEILFDERKHATGITMQPRGTANDGKSVLRIKVKKEVVLTAGSLHSPHVLQRSGIGPKWLLEQAGIDVLVDLPGVGSNLQDHPRTSLQGTCTCFDLGLPCTATSPSRLTLHPCSCSVTVNLRGQYEGTS